MSSNQHSLDASVNIIGDSLTEVRESFTLKAEMMDTKRSYQTEVAEAIVIIQVGRRLCII